MFGRLFFCIGREVGAVTVESRRYHSEPRSMSDIGILQQQHGLNGCIKQVQLKSRQLPLLKAAGETARRKEETDFY
jgi:hypothetical protein